MPEEFVCANCGRVGVLSTNGRCAVCGSDAVAPEALLPTEGGVDVPKDPIRDAVSDR